MRIIRCGTLPGEVPLEHGSVHSNRVTIGGDDPCCAGPDHSDDGPTQIWRRGRRRAICPTSHMRSQIATLRSLDDPFRLATALTASFSAYRRLMHGTDAGQISGSIVAI